MLQGPYGSLGDREKPLIRLPFTDFAVGTVLLALTGLIACIVISLMIHFDESTYTHCQVPNYLPSISASISLVPERYIWRFCIGLHSAPRFLVAAVYFCFYRGRFAKSFPDLALSGLALITAIVENVGLLLLTYVSSTETYSVHKNGFITFIASSLLHMLITCRLWQVIKKFSLNPELCPSLCLGWTPDVYPPVLEGRGLVGSGWHGPRYLSPRLKVPCELSGVPGVGRSIVGPSIFSRRSSYRPSRRVGICGTAKSGEAVLVPP
uniref:Acyltransferase PGAP2 n=1 Tax=Esox lucius TaxID=8010 RepID=A0AAY5KYG0_ESOLU